MRVIDREALTARWFPGRARGSNEVVLSFRVAGPLVEFPVRMGDDVEIGQLLARVDPTDFEVALRNIEGTLARARANLEAMRIARPEDIEKLRAAVEAAEATLRLAESELERSRTLLARNVIARSEFENRQQQRDVAAAELQRARESLNVAERGARPEDIAAQEAEIKSLDAAVAAARNNVQYTALRAPFAGSVSATFADNFEFVNVRQPIVRLIDVSRIEMTIDIPERFISLAPYVVGFECVFDAFPDLVLPAEIKELGTEASATTRTYPVTLSIEQPEGARILAGMSGRAHGRVELPETVGQEGLTIPVSAVLAGRYVWVIDESTRTVSKREIVPGAVSSLGIAVQGLSPDEWIATAGVHSLTEGQQVSILSEPLEP